MNLVACLALFGLVGGECNAFSSPTMSSATPKHTLFDIPVSNNGARCRIIIYKVSEGTSKLRIRMYSLFHPSAPKLDRSTFITRFLNRFGRSFLDNSSIERDP
jgi:hypothetical protein